MSDQPHPFEARLGYAFSSPALLVEALTHASFRNESAGELRDYERLEFLGDAVFELVVSELLFRRLPSASEGRLTQLRARLVNARELARIATELDLGAHVRVGRGEALSGGRQRSSILADVLEAVVAAVYLDGGFEAAVVVVERLLASAVETALTDATVKDAKSRLQEWTQGHHQVTPHYEVVACKGPAHETWYEVTVHVGPRLSQRGEGRTKKAAEQVAAQAALDVLVSADSGAARGTDDGVTESVEEVTG